MYMCNVCACLCACKMVCVRAYVFLYTYILHIRALHLSVVCAGTVTELPNERFSTVVMLSLRTHSYTRMSMCVCVCVFFVPFLNFDWHCKMVLRAAYLYNTDYCCCAKNNDAKINTWPKQRILCIVRSVCVFRRSNRMDLFYIRTMCVCVCVRAYEFVFGGVANIFSVVFTILTLIRSLTKFTVN